MDIFVHYIYRLLYSTTGRLVYGATAICNLAKLSKYININLILQRLEKAQKCWKYIYLIQDIISDNVWRYFISTIGAWRRREWAYKVSKFIIKHAKNANYTRSYLLYFTIFRNQTLQFY
jgi:hypothetical protein